VTPQEFADKMREIFEPDSHGSIDKEVAHSEADELMQLLLHDLGYQEGVDILKAHRLYYG